MCPWVGPHAPSFGRQLWGLPSRVEYLSPQGVLLPLVYSTTASPLWLELRGLSAWQATPSWTVYRPACHRSHAKEIGRGGTWEVLSHGMCILAAT